MRDDFLTRDWAEHHGELSTGIAAALAKAARVIAVSLARVHAYEFDAPWRVAEKARPVRRDAHCA